MCCFSWAVQIAHATGERPQNPAPTSEPDWPGLRCHSSLHGVWFRCTWQTITTPWCATPSTSSRPRPFIPSPVPHHSAEPRPLLRQRSPTTSPRAPIPVFPWSGLGCLASPYRQPFSSNSTVPPKPPLTQHFKEFPPRHTVQGSSCLRRQRQRCQHSNVLPCLPRSQLHSWESSL